MAFIFTLYASNPEKTYPANWSFCAETFEINEKAVNDIYLNSWVKGIFTFTAAQTASLENIAYQCPLTGGSAVFRARSMLEVIGSYDFGDDETNCNGVQQRSNLDSSDTPNKFLLYPNPANDAVDIVFPENTSGIIHLSDYPGHEIIRQKFTAIRNFQLDISSLPPGLYLCHIRSDTGEEHNEKLIIIH